MHPEANPSGAGGRPQRDSRGRPPAPFVNPIYDGPIETVDLDRVHWLAGVAVGFIHSRQAVLSHCQMGWNRSGLLTGIIMCELGFRGDVVAHIRRRRGPSALCNAGFERYVRTLQETGDRRQAYEAARRSPEQVRHLIPGDDAEASSII